MSGKGDYDENRNKINMRQILNNSEAIAQAVKMCRPAVVAAYPITPQTHIIERLAEYRANNEADYEFILAESEFSAASIVLGASAAGSRAYTATASQGLLLMTEVLYNIAGLRLPIVLTCANRAISAPINIWNDQQDAMAARDAGWIMLFCEDIQEAVDSHIQAFKIAEQCQLPVMVNIDGFYLTHTFEPADIPDQKVVDKFLPPYQPRQDTILDLKTPRTFGQLVGPDFYQETRLKLHQDLKTSKRIVQKIFQEWQGMLKRAIQQSDGLIAYQGPQKPEVIIVAMGSILGTIKTVLQQKPNLNKKIGLLKIRCFRPFPDKEVAQILKNTEKVIVFDRAISLGTEGILSTEIRRALYDLKQKPEIHSIIAGLGGREITSEFISSQINNILKK